MVIVHALQVDFMPVYSAHLREIIKKGVDHPENYEQPLKGFKIIVDAGNGSGGFLASDVLAPLGADTSGARLQDLPSKQMGQGLTLSVSWGSHLLFSKSADEIPRRPYKSILVG